MELCGNSLSSLLDTIDSFWMEWKWESNGKRVLWERVVRWVVTFWAAPLKIQEERDRKFLVSFDVGIGDVGRDVNYSLQL